MCFFFFFSSRRRHTRFDCDWSSDVCSSDLDRWFHLGTRDLLLPGEPDRHEDRILHRTDHLPRPWCRDAAAGERPGPRSEEHTSELQSQSNLVCRLLLEKKKKKKK